MSRERAIALVTGLVWRGVAGVPPKATHEDVSVPG